MVFYLLLTGTQHVWYQVISGPDGKRKGIYKHPILQKAVNAMWFKNKRDEGIVFPDLFNPISVHSIALILTAVSNLLSHFTYLIIFLHYRSNATSMSGLTAPRQKLHFGRMITAQFMKATSRLLLRLASIRSLKIWIFLVCYNVNSITMDGGLLIF